MNKDNQFLLDMLQSAELIKEYTNNCSKKNFISSVLLQDAVIRRLLIIAEAARISEDTKQKLVHISWR